MHTALRWSAESGQTSLGNHFSGLRIHPPSTQKCQTIRGWNSHRFLTISMNFYSHIWSSSSSNIYSHMKDYVKWIPSLGGDSLLLHCTQRPCYILDSSFCSVRIIACTPVSRTDIDSIDEIRWMSESIKRHRTHAPNSNRNKFKRGITGADENYL